MDGRAELKNKTLLPGPNHFHKDHHNLNITSSFFTVFTFTGLSATFGVLLHASCWAPHSPSRFSFFAGLFDAGLSRILPTVAFFFFSHTTFTWMSTSEAFPSRCAGLGFSLCLSCIDLQLTEFTWIHPLIYSFTWLFI